MQEIIQKLLIDQFPKPSIVSVEDTHGDGQHFTITVTSSQFKGLPLIKQHQQIYQILNDLITSNQIHAVKIKTNILN